jgi:adenylosuccinate synthase
VQHKRIQTLAVLGGQWGDEGKGKLVDLLSDRFDAVARYHGGHNAGHTVKFGDRHFALHLLPAGVIRGRESWIGDGVVLDPDALFEEIDGLRENGIDAEGHLRISDRAHLILPYHRLLDAAREQAAGDGKIGTTLRGIRTGALRHPETLLPKVERLARETGAVAAALGTGTPPPAAEVFARLCEQSKRLIPLLDDTGCRARRHLKSGKSLLAEGAHGAMLDLSAGTYPFVTSSTCSSAGLAAGLRIPPNALTASLVVLKAYTTRVGAGPFPTELHDETGEFLRKRGNEYGTSTGRPRRTGWFDAVVARSGVELSGARYMAITKLDVLDTLAEIPVCVGYKIRGERVLEFPSDVEDVEAVEPLYTRSPGWKKDTTGVTDFDDLPPRAKEYVKFLEQLCGATAVAVSTGPRREETIFRRQDEFWDRLPPAIA